jgi:hypothetical protein
MCIAVADDILHTFAHQTYGKGPIEVLTALTDSSRRAERSCAPRFSTGRGVVYRPPDG